MIEKRNLSHWHVLVVDDEPDSLEVATRVLRFNGATVYNAANGKEALEYLETLEPLFILSDLSMPVMDGWEFLYNVKNNPKTANIPVIALTAHGMPGDKERALNVGFSCYMTKPLSPFTFMDELLKLLVEHEKHLVQKQTNPFLHGADSIGAKA